MIPCGWYQYLPSRHFHPGVNFRGSRALKYFTPESPSSRALHACHRVPIFPVPLFYSLKSISWLLKTTTLNQGVGQVWMHMISWISYNSMVMNCIWCVCVCVSIVGPVYAIRQAAISKLIIGIAAKNSFVKSSVTRINIKSRDKSAIQTS